MRRLPRGVSRRRRHGLDRCDRRWRKAALRPQPNRCRAAMRRRSCRRARLRPALPVPPSGRTQHESSTRAAGAAVDQEADVGHPPGRGRPGLQKRRRGRRDKPAAPPLLGRHRPMREPLRTGTGPSPGVRLLRWVGLPPSPSAPAWQAGRPSAPGRRRPEQTAFSRRVCRLPETQSKVACRTRYGLASPKILFFVAVLKQ